MLSWLTGPIVQAIASGLFGNIEKAWESYVKKEISKEQLLEQLQAALLSTFRDVEVAYADAIAKTYASFMATLAQSKLMQAVWAAVVLSQLAVLLWHQFGIPFVVFMKWTDKYPSSGATVEWAYLLIAFCLGAGPAVLRGGPAGSAGMIGALKNMVGIK